jgi:MFS family permease
MPSNTLRELVRTRFRALRYRNFRLYWMGQLVSLIGTWMQSVAQGWLMHRLTASAFMLGLLGFVQFLPVLLFSLLAGVVADRFDKRRLLLLTQTAFLVQAGLLAAFVTAGAVQPWMLLVFAFAYGVFNAFDMPTRQAIIVELVTRDDLSNAIALNSAAFNAARIVGPAAAGVLVATLPGLLDAAGLGRLFPSQLAGEAGCFWINALSYIAVLVSLSRIELAPREAIPNAAETGALAKLAEGVRYALGQRSIRSPLVLLAFAGGFGFQYLTLLPVYAREILQAGADAYGLLVSAFGLGALAAAAILTRRSERRDLRRNVFVGLATAGAGLGVFAWSRWLPLSLAMGFLAGYGLILYVASTNTLLQLATEDRFRGRVMSLYTRMFVGMAPFGALLTGVIAQRTSAPVATSMSAAILIGSAAWVLRRLQVTAARDAQRAAQSAIEERIG